MSENKIIRTEYGMCPKCNGEGWVFETGISTNITKQCGLCNGTKFITSAIESALNDTVVEKSFDAMVREMNESHARYIADNSPVKLFTESEVDAIRADTWKAAREQNGFDSLRWTSFDAYLTSLNLNTNDTGKEDIRDNKINLLEEDLAVVHHYLDDLSVPRKHEGGDAYSIVGRIKQLELYYMKKLSEIESEYLSKQQPTNDNAFVWTDELLHKFINSISDEWEFSVLKQEIDFFKQSKQSAPVDTGKNKFKIGDVVTKVNGTIKMTVEGYGYRNENMYLPYPHCKAVQVVYFRPNGQVRRKTINEDKLMIYTEPKQSAPEP